MSLHPLFVEICAAHGMAPETYRGWTIHRGRWPEPTYMATGPNYDAWIGDEGEWTDNGEKVDGFTPAQLTAEIDAWFEENGHA